MNRPEKGSFWKLTFPELVEEPAYPKDEDDDRMILSGAPSARFERLLKTVSTLSGGRAFKWVQSTRYAACRDLSTHAGTER